MESWGPSLALVPTRNSKLIGWKALQVFWKNLPVTLLSFLLLIKVDLIYGLPYELRHRDPLPERERSHRVLPLKAKEFLVSQLFKIF